MAKWQSPREIKQREIAKVVAGIRPEAQAAVDTLTRDWTTIPADWQEQILHVVWPLIQARGLANSLAFDVRIDLMEAFTKPYHQRRLRERRAAEKAAEALVDTSRPVVATVSGQHHVGELVLLRDRDGSQRVLVCIRAGYVPEQTESNDSSGDLADLAEPNDTERATANFQRLQARIDADAAYEAHHRQIVAARAQRELDAIRTEGREPTFFEDLFAGSSDN
jgi:hypothetical protein